jgi:hypothetical protein
MNTTLLHAAAALVTAFAGAPTKGATSRTNTTLLHAAAALVTAFAGAPTKEAAS